MWYNISVKSIAFLLAIFVAAIGVFYFNPWRVREKTASAILESKFLPEIIQAQAQKILLTPSQRRLELLEKLEKNLGNIKNVVIQQVTEGKIIKSPEISKSLEILKEAENVIEKIKESNSDPGLMSAIVGKIAEEIKNGISPANQGASPSSSSDGCKN